MTKIEPFMPHHYERVLSMELRKGDLDEAMAFSKVSPVETMLWTIQQSDDCLSVVHNGEIEAFYGVVNRRTYGVPWFFSTKKFEEFRMKFIRRSKAGVLEMHKKYKRLENYIDHRQTASIRWLKWLGFTIDEDRYYFNDPSIHFYKFHKEID